jgi:hypothetical protein
MNTLRQNHTFASKLLILIAAVAVPLVITLSNAKPASAFSCPSPLSSDKGCWTPDPGIWCKEYGDANSNTASGTTYSFQGIKGGTTQSNPTECKFGVDGQIPVGEDSYEIIFPLSVGVNEAQACEQQFPGSTLEWLPSATCVAPANRNYPPPTAP